jgi:hypothetical protein
VLRVQQKRSARVLHLPARAWATGAVAVLIIGIAGGGALFANQAQTASAAEALYQLQVEAVGPGPDVGIGPCGPANAEPPVRDAAIAVQAGAGDGGGPVTIGASDAAQLSDRLAQALGVSGDRVRQAMRAAIGPDLPSKPPPDPIGGIAKQLGVSTEQVCAAFSNGAASGGFTIGQHVSKSGGTAAPSTVLNIGGTQINLDSNDPNQVSAPAKKLGVTPERLLAAIKAATPTPPAVPPSPPNSDELIDRLAQNLGMSPDRVRAAITQVEGPNRFYFAVPLPGLSH